MDNPCYKNDRQPKTSERRRRFGITGYNYHCVCPSGNALKKNCQHPFENDPSARREWLGEPEWGGGNIGSYKGGPLDLDKDDCSRNPSACRDPA